MNMILMAAATSDRIRYYVSSRCGLYFKDHDLKNLDDSIKKRINTLQIDSLETYYKLLISQKDYDEEFRELMSLLTVNHTFFFRNELQFNILKNKLLPELLAKKGAAGDFSLKIWSAGCSSGEEPYTIAMVLLDIMDDLTKWNIEVLATDVSQKSLDKAISGKYSINSMKLVDDYRKSRYFVRTDDGFWKIRDELKKLVSFQYFNLMEDVFPENADIIFCRNVVIYFNTETTKRIFNKFYNSLRNHGYMFIGYSESLQSISDKFQMEYQGEAIYYRKKLVQQVQTVFKLPAAEPDVPVFESHRDIKSEIYNAYENKKYGLALELIENEIKIKVDKELLFLCAEINLNLGNIERSKEVISRLLLIDKLYAPAYYLLANMSQAGNVENLKKAIFIDKNFVLARFMLAGVYKNEGDISSSLREYKNTIAILAKLKPDEKVVFSGGFSAATMISICRDNIELLETGVS